MSLLRSILIWLLLSGTYTYAQTASDSLTTRWWLQSSAYYKTARYDSAVWYLQQISNLQPNNTNVLLGIAKSLYEQQQYNQALEYCSRVDKIHLGKASFTAALCYAAMHDTVKVFKCLEQNLKSRYKQPRATVKTSQQLAFLWDTRPWNDFWAKNWYSRLDNMLADADYLIRNAEYYQALDLLDQTTARYRKNAQAYSLRARAYQAINQPADAIADLSVAIKLQPDNAEYLKQRAQVYMLTEQYLQAATDYTKAIQADVADIDLYLQRAEAFSYAQRTDEAHADIDLYLGFLPNDSDAWLQKALICNRANECIDALPILNRLVAQNPKNIVYLQHRAYSFVLCRAYQQAFNDYSRLLDISPNNGSYYLHRAQARLGYGDTTGACSDFRKALLLNQQQAQTFINNNCN